MARQGGQLSGHALEQAETQIAHFERDYGKRIARALQLHHPEMLQKALAFADVTCAMLLNTAGYDKEAFAGVGLSSQAVPPPRGLFCHAF